MSKKMKVAFACHLIAMSIVAGFGLAYLLPGEFMPHHAVATGMSWDTVSAPLQILILGLMRAVGIACLAVFALALFILLVPFRQGAVWARWALPAGGLLLAVGRLYPVVFLALHTRAKPLWMGPAAGALLILAGLVLSLLDLLEARTEK